MATQSAASASESYRDGFLQQPVLILRGTPAAGDDDGDPLDRGINCRCLGRVEQHRIEVGHCGMGVVKNRGGP